MCEWSVSFSSVRRDVGRCEQACDLNSATRVMARAIASHFVRFVHNNETVAFCFCLDASRSGNGNKATCRCDSLTYTDTIYSPTYISARAGVVHAEVVPSAHNDGRFASYAWKIAGI
jgi:hypothetical protein